MILIAANDGSEPIQTNAATSFNGGFNSVSIHYCQSILLSSDFAQKPSPTMGRARLFSRSTL